MSNYEGFDFEAFMKDRKSKAQPEQTPAQSEQPPAQPVQEPIQSDERPKSFVDFVKQLKQQTSGDCDISGDASGAVVTGRGDIPKGIIDLVKKMKEDGMSAGSVAVGNFTDEEREELENSGVICSDGTPTGIPELDNLIGQFMKEVNPHAAMIAEIQNVFNRFNDENDKIDKDEMHEIAATLMSSVWSSKKAEFLASLAGIINYYSAQVIVEKAYDVISQLTSSLSKYSVMILRDSVGNAKEDEQAGVSFADPEHITRAVKSDKGKLLRNDLIETISMNLLYMGMLAISFNCVDDVLGRFEVSIQQVLDDIDDEISEKEDSK